MAPAIRAPYDPSNPNRTSLPAIRSTAITDDAILRCIAIDGPTASGKSVVGRALADLLHLGFFDTGLMYRACTLAVLEAGVDPNDEAAVAALILELDLDVRWPEPNDPRILLTGVDVTPKLRAAIIEQNVSLISRIEDVRHELVRRQRAIANREPVVMAGRDIGTRVLVEARTKVFLDASTEIRARRRLGEEQVEGRASTFETVLEATRRRDEMDNTGHRAVKREQAAEGALIVDTDAIGIDEVVAQCAELYRQVNALS